VYPETMGVPLEEMDAVFGEGNTSGDSERRINLTQFFSFSDEQEEQFDNQSERTSLISGGLPTNHSAIVPSRSRQSRGWFSRLLNGNDRRTNYVPTSSSEE
jgi:hypothetical protein